jgi:hypothetical protein
MKVYIVEDDYKFIRPLPIQLNKDGKPKKKQKGSGGTIQEDHPKQEGYEG